MLVNVIRHCEELHGWEVQWNALLDRCADRDVQYSYQWYHNWIDSFIGKDTLRLAVARNDNDLLAIFPLYQDWFNFKGLRVRAVRSLTNYHSNRFDIIGEKLSAEQVSILLRAGLNDSGCSLMILDLVPAQSNLMNTVRQACADNNYRLLIREHSVNCLVRAEASFDEYYRGVDGKFRKNVNAAERKAAECGELVLQALTVEDGLADFLKRGYAIEASGWKGVQGSAIEFDSKAKDFYTNLAKDFFKNDWLSLYLLQNGKDDMSFYYCIGRDGVIRALKIGINQKLARLAPGMVLTKHVMKELIDEKGMQLWDFCGGSSRWKMDWANQTEKLYSMYIFADSGAGAMYHSIGKLYTVLHERIKARKSQPSTMYHLKFRI